ncbi:hypothetical protein VHUM_01141 [Vanrija humicola]|uniref:Lipid droplet-associated perilipin protein n=1 Tax=Vanrija humicola TaxID=5417 RepID=A0A7D8Z703_VANHU|nr:hypothetical protein VHUM_01141 [Vanrija humicola]
MAATVQTQPNGDVPSEYPAGCTTHTRDSELTQQPDFKIVERLDSVPVVHDSIAYAQSLINSTQLTTNLYNTAAGIASRSYEIATPILVRAKPVLESADKLAVASFDRAESVFPYPFKTPTEDLVGVKQAKAVYDSQATPVMQEVINKTTAINNQLGVRVHAAIQESSEISHQLLEQLRTLADSSKELPHHLIEGLTKSTNDVKAIVLDKDATIQDKTNKLGAYVVDQVKPVIDEIYNYVLGAKKAYTEKVDKATEKAAPAPAEKAAPAPAAAAPAPATTEKATN